MKAILILSLVSAANLTSAPVVIAGENHYNISRIVNLNTPEECKTLAETLCRKYIKNHKKYQYCLQEVYGQCIHQ